MNEKEYLESFIEFLVAFVDEGINLKRRVIEEAIREFLAYHHSEYMSVNFRRIDEKFDHEI